MIDQTIDWNLCLKLSNRDENYAKELLHLLFQSILPDYQRIKQLYDEKILTELAEQVHRFHGGLCYTGLPSLRMATKKLENMIATKDFAKMDQAFALFTQEVEQALLTWENYPHR